MDRSIGARRVATLVGDFDRAPAYAGLADALVLLIGDGRIAAGTRLPSERELTEALGVSRTTITRAYAALRDAGYAEARHGSGTFTQVPGGASRAHDRALLPREAGDLIDLNCAAPFAPPQIAQAYADAATRLPAYLGGHGYFPSGLPALQAAIAAEYDAAGIPTHPQQVMVTPGALAAVSVVAHALTRNGCRWLVESPGYPNAAERMRTAGARVVGTSVDPDGWDLDALEATVRQSNPLLAYLIPDFQNPTGLLMDDDQRARLAGILRTAGTTPVVDETHVLLGLEPDAEMPRRFGTFAQDTISVGSASKCFWGGLRVGWLRAPIDLMDKLVQARVTLDLGVPVMEQLALLSILEDPTEILTTHRAALREQRDALVAMLRKTQPEWGFRVPDGGLCLWIELPATPGQRGLATALAHEAERRGVVVAPGPVFAAEGGLDRFVRIPWTRRVDELETAVERIGEAWAEVSTRRTAGRRTAGPVMVA
jgi:DNA-binding transcriptional MocR family regulator